MTTPIQDLNADTAVQKKKGSKQEVYDGIAMCTAGGLKREDLCMNAKNKIVSKKRSEQGKKQIEHLKGKKKTIEPIKEPEKEPEPIPNALEEKLNQSREEIEPQAEIKKEPEPELKIPEENNLPLESIPSGKVLKEKKPRKPRKIVSRKLENPVIDEILYTNHFDYLPSANNQ